MKKSHFSKLSFSQFWKKLGLGQTPPPSLGQIPNFYRKFVLGASLMSQEELNSLEELISMGMDNQKEFLSGENYPRNLDF